MKGQQNFLCRIAFFIPMLRDAVGWKPTNVDIDSFIKKACDTFIVPEMAVRYRLENLSYEILQFYSGTELVDINILSKKQQERNGLHLMSLNTIPDGAAFDIYEYINEKSHPCWRRNDFWHNSLTGLLRKIYFASQPNYIIPGASWQGVGFYTQNTGGGTI